MHKPSPSLFNNRFIAALILMVAAAFAAPLANAQRTVALLIGNSAYRSESILRNPGNDVRLMERVLRQDLKFDVVRVVTDATTDQMSAALEQFANDARGARTALIYYTGHGMTNSTRMNYALPVDIPNFSADANFTSSRIDDQLARRAVSEDQFVNAISSAAVQVLILDACRDNRASSAKRSVNKGLARRAEESRNRLIAYATTEGNVAKDGAGNNSPYAESLAKYLSRRDWPLLKVFDEVASDVERGTNNQQSPTRTGNLRVDVYLINPTITANNGPVAPPILQRDAEEEAYKAAIAADVVDGYEQYLRDFEKGRNVSAVKIRLAAAKRREARVSMSASPPASPTPSYENVIATRPASVPPVKWDLASAYSSSNFHTVNLSQFADELDRMTGGRLSVKVHSNASLLKAPEIKRSVQNGSVQLGEILLVNYQSEWQIFGADGVPFLATGYEEAARLYRAQKPMLERKLAEQGMLLLFSVPWAPQGIYSRRRLSGVADMSGIKWRAYSPTTARLAELLGARPVTVQAFELFGALSNGAIDSYMSSSTTGLDTKTHEHLKYYYDVQAWLPKNAVILNRRAFDALDKQTQSAVLRAASDAETRGWELSRRTNEDALRQLRAFGMQISSPSASFVSELTRIGGTLTSEWLAGAGADGQQLMRSYR